MISITWRSRLRVAAWALYTAVTIALVLVAFTLGDPTAGWVMVCCTAFFAAMTVRAWREHRWRMRAYERLLAFAQTLPADERNRRLLAAIEMEKRRQAAPYN